MGEAAPRQPTIPKVTASAPRILLVDDELSVQKLLTYPLRKEGYDVIPALDGREALDRLREDDFDLVVLDVMLPRMDGFDVCRAIRSRSTVPIIMLTAKTEETDKVLGRAWGDAAYRDPRTIDVHIRHLRQKLESEPKTPELILTVRGVGYRFRDR